MMSVKKIINGTMEPQLSPEEEEQIPAEAKAAEVDNGIEGYWLQAMGQLEEIGDYITEEDVPLLLKITDIRCTISDDYDAFTLHFHFAENDFMTNSVLTKTYTVDPHLLTEEAPALTGCEASPIEWKDGQDLTVREIKKKQKAKSGKNKGQTRMVTKIEPKASFFHYFKEPREDDEDEEEEDEDEEEKPGFTVDTDYDIAHVIRVSLLPESVFWFTGENGDDDEDFDEDEDEEDSEDEEDEEESEEEEAPKAKSKGKKKSNMSGNAATGFALNGGDAPPGGADNPECKQN